jgi:hypothetical protein
MAIIMCGMFPEDVEYQHVLAEAYFAAGRHSEAQDAFRTAVHRDNANEIAEGSPRHKVQCVDCNAWIHHAVNMIGAPTA